MFSGKTKTLISTIEDFKSKGKKVIVFKPKLDNRYAEEEVVSHDSDSTPAVNVTRPVEIMDLFHQADVVAIDEIQFFDESIVSVCGMIADQGKSVVAAGLDMDYRGKPFGAMPTLMSVADEVVKLNSVCTFCSGKARFSHRVSEEGDVVVLGEKDKYVPLCRSCYNELKSE
jgi:thymidine kinase